MAVADAQIGRSHASRPLPDPRQAAGFRGNEGRRARFELSVGRPGRQVIRDQRVDRLIGLCQQVGASEYLSGPAAKSYLDETRFNEFGIAVRWMDYAGYPPYPQLHSPPFLHDVTVLDLLLNVGLERAEDYLLAARTLP